MSKIKKNKKPWATKKVMDQIYDLKLWGDNSTQFYSGEGSHQSEIIEPYIKEVTTFLRSFKNLISICDLGCGDFNIGKHFVKYTKKYIAIDIVESLIKFNKNNFTALNLEFLCLDIATDNLPKADCVILRQVLQHLSNKEVHNIVKKIKNYKFVILTEHLPKEDFTPNKDIISGQGIRLKKNSGINLLAAPFNLKIKREKELHSLTLDNNKGKIVTTLFEVF